MNKCTDNVFRLYEGDMDYFLHIRCACNTYETVQIISSSCFWLKLLLHGFQDLYIIFAINRVKHFLTFTLEDTFHIRFRLWYNQILGWRFKHDSIIFIAI